MSSRRGRARRVAETAERLEELARLEAFGASQRLRAAEAAIGDATEQTRRLGATGMTPGLRGLLATAGARNLAVLDQRRRRLNLEATTRRHDWERSRQRTRSFQKLAERIEAAQQAQRRRAEAAELLDVISSVAVAES